MEMELGRKAKERGISSRRKRREKDGVRSPHLSENDRSFDRKHREGRFVLESVSNSVNVVELGALNEEDRFEAESFVRRVGEEGGEEGEE